jgi:O-antigen/teichoic acid export membrane protein
MLLPFVSVYTSGITDVNYNVPTVAFLFVVNGILYNIKTPQSMLINSAGLYKETKVQTIIQGAIMVVLGAILAPILGLEGILIASCASNLYRTIDLLFFIPKNVTKLPVYSSALRMLSVLIVCGVIYLPFLFVKINVSGYLGWVVWAMGVSVFAAVCVFVMCVVTGKNELKNVLERIKGLIFRR